MEQNKPRIMKNSTTLLEFAALNYNLTSNQKEALNDIAEFLSSDKFCFVLKGYAGTGKTFLLGVINAYFKTIKRDLVFAAPTGRAAKVINNSIKAPAYTIHKTIYSKNNFKEFKIKNLDGSETFKYSFQLKNNEDQANTVYLIDEASMISDVYNEMEFFRFGSGHLLRDLFNYVNMDNNDHRKKIILVGDDAQLPPVGMNFSPALDSDYLLNSIGYRCSISQLREVVRQKADSKILLNAKKLRVALEKKAFCDLSIQHNDSDCIKLEHGSILKRYLHACDNKINDKCVIVAHSNSQVLDYNKMVRSVFFPNKAHLQKNDRLIIVANNYSKDVELLNGDFARVTDVAENIETRNITLKIKKESGEVEERNISLTFRDVILELAMNDEQKVQVRCKVFDKLLNSRDRDISSDEQKALYIDFKIRNPHLKNGTPEFGEALSKDVYFNVIRVKYGYAVTCHKSQGGEWKHVFLNCAYSSGMQCSDYFRWLYTGITRAKEVLHTINAPSFSMHSSMNAPNMTVFLNKQTIQNKQSLAMENTNTWRTVLNEIAENNGLVVSNINEKQFQFHVHLKTTNKEELRFIINYKKDNCISKIQTIDDFESLDDFVSEINSLIGLTISESENNKKNTNSNQEKQSNCFKADVEFPADFLKDFYEATKAKVNRAGISISAVRHKNWHEIYDFSHEGETAIYKFYYNGKNRIKKHEVHPKSSAQLVHKLNQIFVEN